MEPLTIAAAAAAAATTTNVKHMLGSDPHVFVKMHLHT